MAEPITAVIVMAYGTPATTDDIETYYTDIRRGRPPTEEQLAELTRRYKAIGGLSPLAQRTQSQVEAIQARLDREAPGTFRCWLGQKHASPTIEEAVGAGSAAGADAFIGVVLAPHYSSLSVQQYLDRLDAAASEAGIHQVVGIPSWHDSDPWIDAQANRVRAALESVGGDAAVVFTAHSLPERILTTGDPYPDQLRESAQVIADRAGVSKVRLAWQSAGRSPEPWLGPDILTVLRELTSEGINEVVVCPHGFTSDHLEVLYDIDIEAAQVASKAGVKLVRTQSLNDDPGLVDAVAAAILAVEI